MRSRTNRAASARFPSMAPKHARNATRPTRRAVAAIGEIAQRTRIAYPDSFDCTDRESTVESEFLEISAPRARRARPTSPTTVNAAANDEIANARRHGGRVSNNCDFRGKKRKAMSVHGFALGTAAFIERRRARARRATRRVAGERPGNASASPSCAGVGSSGRRAGQPVATPLSSTPDEPARADCKRHAVAPRTAEDIGANASPAFGGNVRHRRERIRRSTVWSKDRKMSTDLIERSPVAPLRPSIACELAGRLDGIRAAGRPRVGSAPAPYRLVSDIAPRAGRFDHATPHFLQAREHAPVPDAPLPSGRIFEARMRRATARRALSYDAHAACSCALSSRPACVALRAPSGVFGGDPARADLDAALDAPPRAAAMSVSGPEGPLARQRRRCRAAALTRHPDSTRLAARDQARDKVESPSLCARRARDAAFGLACRALPAKRLPAPSSPKNVRACHARIAEPTEALSGRARTA